MMEKTIKKIKLNKSNFYKVIASLWINQKVNETYEFKFEDQETEIKFDNLCKRFM